MLLLQYSHTKVTLVEFALLFYGLFGLWCLQILNHFYLAFSLKQALSRYNINACLVHLNKYPIFVYIYYVNLKQKDKTINSEILRQKIVFPISE